MANVRKQQRAKAARKQRPQRSPMLCQICGQLVFRVERDHPFRRDNDVDFTITVCVPCHLKVTAWDNALDRHVSDPAMQAAMPFLYIMHRIQLTFAKRGIETVYIDLRHLEKSVLTTVGQLSYAPARFPRKRFGQVSDSDALVLLTDLATWVKRASELTLERLSTVEREQFGPAFDAVASVAGSVYKNPLQFYSRLVNTQSPYLDDFMAAVQNSASEIDIYTLWLKLADIVNDASEGVS